MSGLYSRNKLFDKMYPMGVQDLPGLVDDVSVEGAITMSVLENYEDYLPEGWADFIEIFCE